MKHAPDPTQSPMLLERVLQEEAPGEGLLWG